MKSVIAPRGVFASASILAAFLTSCLSATPLDNSWDLASVAGKPVTVQANGAATFSGTTDTARAYLGTNKSDFQNSSFVAEVNVTVNNGSGNGCAFVGLGAGTPDAGFYQEPRTTPANYLRLAPSDFSSGYLTFNDNTVSTTIANPGPGNGTHRVRLIWDAATRRLQTDIDANSSSGVFVRDYGRVNYSSATGLAAGNSRLFVGGAGGVSFGPLSVRAATANDLALIDYSATRWMSALNGSVKLSQISIPGTHDSAARVENWPSTAKCQNLSIAEQLNAGVRYLDARCRHIGDSFSMHHGEVYQNLRFGDVLNDVYGFLNANPGETVMMVVKEEYDPSGNTRSFEDTFNAYVAGNPGRWWLGTSIPTLDETRGKIVLVRRFGANVAKGINATNWPDNTNFNVNNLVVEDHYVVNDYAGKWNFDTAGFNSAYADTNPAVLHLTHTSGYDPDLFGIPDIQNVANYMNPKVNSWFTGVKPGHYGCVIMDFADSGNASLIYQTNFPQPGPIPDGVYQVLAKHSGSSLDVTGGSTAPGAYIQQWQWGGGNNQRWTFTNLGAGLYRISALHSGLALDMETSSTSNGGRVLQYYYNGTPNQIWRVTANGDGSHRITNLNSGLVLDIEAASGANGAKVEQWAWNGGDNQRWLLQSVNRAPVFTTPARIFCCEGGPISGSLAAADPDPGHSPVRFAKAGGPSWLNIAADGTISGTAPPDSAGDLTVTVLADDPLGAVASATLPITINPTPTWKQPAGGDWLQSANWQSGLIGGAANGPAVDFSTLDLTVNAAVNLASPVSLNRLDFADITPSHNWSLTGAAALTLVGPTTPIISVANQTTTIGAPVIGTSGLIKSGAGTLAFTGNNTLTGPVDVQQGTLGFAGTYGSAALSVASGAVLELQVASGLTDYATSTLSGAGTLLKTGAGTSRWGVQAASFALGAGSLIDVRAGTFDAGSSANENWSGNLSSLNVNSGATINELTYGPAVFDALTGSGSVEGAGGSTLTLGANNTAAGTYNPAGAANFSGVISSVSSLIKIGTGTQALSGTNTYAGVTTISGGILQIGNGGTTGTLGSGNVVNNSVLQFYRSGSCTVPNAISGTGAVYVKPGNDLTLSGAITCNTLRFHEGGNRTVRLTGSAANTFGAVEDSQDGHGTLVFAKSAGVNAFSGAVLDVGSGYASQFLLRLENNEQIANATQVNLYGWDGGYGGQAWFRLNGYNETIAGLAGGSSTSYVQNGAAGPSRLTLAGSGTYSVRGAINDGGTGALGILKSGTGTQTFSGDQIDYTGTTTVTSGRLILLNNDDTWTSGIVVGAGAFVEINRDTATAYEHRNAFTLSGTGTLEKTGAGIVDMSWDQGSTIAMGTGGLIRVKAGTLRLGYGGMSYWTNNKGDLTIDAGAVFDLWDNNNSGVFVDSLSGGGNIVRGMGQTGTLTVGVDGGTGVFSGGISNASGMTNLVKQGGGTQTLSASTGLTYSGTTAVSGGKLLVDGVKSGSGAVTVNTGGTLGGIGSVAGATTIASGGTLAPGSNGIGVLTLNALTLAGGSKLDWEIANWTGAAGTGWDKAVVSSLNLTATAAGRITIRPAGLALANFSEASASFLLVQTSSGITGFDPAKFTVDTSGLTLPHGTWAVRQSGNNLVLAYGSPNSDANGNGLLDAWEIACFGNADPGSNPPSGDPDHDGISNLMEYALNSDPLAANGSALTEGLEALADGKHLRLTVPKTPAATNVTYIVETAGDLASTSWSSLDTTIEINTSTQLVVRDNFTTATAPRRFIRLRVKTNP